jgi:hypothetical protein
MQDKREPAFIRRIQLKEQERSEYVRDHGPELIALLAYRPPGLSPSWQSSTGARATALHR